MSENWNCKTCDSVQFRCLVIMEERQGKICVVLVQLRMRLHLELFKIQNLRWTWQFSLWMTMWSKGRSLMMVVRLRVLLIHVGRAVVVTAVSPIMRVPINQYQVQFL